MPGSYVQGQNVDVGTAYSVTVDAAVGITDSFPGVDGAAWDPAKWSIPVAYNASNATVQGGQGRLQVGSQGGYADKVIALSSLPARADGGIAFTVTPVDTTQEWYFQAVLRAQTVDASLGDTACYRLEINNTGGISLAERTNGASTAIGSATSITGWGSGVPARVELFVLGGAVGVRAWTGSTRPSAATISGTDATPLPAGATGLILNGGNAAGALENVLVDDWTTTGPTS